MHVSSRRIAGSTIVVLVLAALAWFLRPTDGDDADAINPDPASVEVGEEQPAEVDGPEPPALTTSTREPLAKAATETPVEEPRPRYTLTGRLLDRDGQPIDPEGCWLWCENGNAEDRRAAIDEDASYGVEELTPGPWLVHAGGDLWRRWSEEIQVLPGEYETRLDIVMEPVIALRIKVVTSDGRALPPLLTKGEHRLVVANGTEKILQPVALRRPITASFLDREDPPVLPYEEAKYRLNGYSGVRLPPEYLGLLVLERDLPVYVGLVLHGLVLDTKLVEGDEREVEFVFDPQDLIAFTSTLQMGLVDAATGEPVTDGYVMFVGWNFSAKLDLDEEGRVEATRWPPGPASLIVSAPGFEEHRDAFVVPSSSTVDLGTVPLHAATWIEGIVVRTDGRPPRNGMVLCKPFAAKDAMHSMFEVGADVDEVTGEFRIPVARGLHLFRATDQDDDGTRFASRMIVVNTTGGSVEGMQVEAVPVVAVTVKANDALPPGLRYRVLDDQGIETRVGTLPARGPQRFHLPPGRYELMVLDEGGGLRQHEGFEVRDEPVSIVVEL